MEVHAPGERARGSVPSSRSDPVPENVKVCPPRYRVPAVGELIEPVGALLLNTVSVAALLVAEPKSLLTTARNVAPLSAGSRGLQRVRRRRGTAMFAPLRCH